MAYAHQPKLDKNTEIVVEDPEISKAYYKVLDSGPHTYTIQATENFELYVNILVPDLPEQPTDLSVLISREQEDPAELAMLEGKNYDRNTFLEPFGYDSYLM